jgi:hypothetical protein
MSEEAPLDAARAAPRSSDPARSDSTPPIVAENVRRVRLGTGANCSSVGSIVDTLFGTTAIGAALFAGIVAALRSEPVRVVHTPRAGERGPAPASTDGEPRDTEPGA